MNCAQGGQSGAVNKTSVKSTAHDADFQEVKKRKRYISNNISQTAKKSTKPVPTSATVKLPQRGALICKFSAPLRATGVHTETTGAENTLPEQEAPRKPGGPPLILKTSTTKLIRIQRDLKDQVEGEYEFRNI
jgi:hypothetical protein